MNTHPGKGFCGTEERPGEQEKKKGGGQVVWSEGTDKADRNARAVLLAALRLVTWCQAAPVL